MVRRCCLTLFAISLLGPSILSQGPTPSIRVAPDADHTVAPQTSASSLDHASHGSGLPLIIDGEQEPSRIPVALSYRHFVRALASVSTAQGIARREFHLKRVGLAQADRDAIVAVLADVAIKLEHIAADRGRAVAHSRGALRAGDSREALRAGAALNAVQHKEREMLNEAAERLRATLSPDASARLDSYVSNEIARRIQIFGSEPQF